MIEAHCYALLLGVSQLGDTEKQLIMYVVIALFVLVVVSLILRELSCWYLKINEMLGLLKEIRNLLSLVKEDSKIIRFRVRRRALEAQREAEGE